MTTHVYVGAGGPDAPPRLLIYAYACEPLRGSEPGAGWGLVRTYATLARCTVLVGSEHVKGLRAWSERRPDAGFTFVEVPEPRWGIAARGHRVTWFLLYLAWLRRAHRVACRLHAAEPFDAVCHATYSTYWLPSPAVRLGIPCILGPVGGAVATPRALRSMLGWRGVPGEWLDFAAVRGLERLPATRRTWERATVLVQNEETRERLPDAIARRACVVNHALFAEVPVPPPASAGAERRLLLVAPLEARKGVRLALRALAATRGVRLAIAGDGPDRPALERLARALGVAQRVEFLGQLPRERVLALMRGARAVVFTGLREEGGIALAEAMAVGAPVIVLAHGGARTIAEWNTDPARVQRIVPGSARATVRRLAEAMEAWWRRPPGSGASTLAQDDARALLADVLDTVLDRDRAARNPAGVRGAQVCA